MSVSLIDGRIDEPKNKPHECPFKNDGKHHWWSSRNTHLCDSALDCSHCYINDMMELRHRNEIQKRGAKVFLCKHSITDTETQVGLYEFACKCEITGNKWKVGAYKYNEDYNTHPCNVPCNFCDLPSCDKCIFRKEVTPENPHGCCGSCAHRLYCHNSKHKDASNVTAEAFIKMFETELERPEGYLVDLSKGVCKKTYEGTCPNYLAYMCNGSQCYIKCACTEQIMKTNVFTVFCRHNHEECPIYREKEGKTNDTRD